MKISIWKQLIIFMLQKKHGILSFLMLQKIFQLFLWHVQN
uniref:Uncharacterized protein n=1 Tax=Pan troglodytes TaxID=9598 RepID=G2HFN1_PANTR|nr:hypothetical protein [Pan troglodytes]